MKLAAWICLSAAPSLAQYKVQSDSDLVRLEDTRTQTVVSILVSHGNMAFDMKVKGRNVLRNPYASVEDFRKSRNMNGGVPFLGPWANRLDEPAFYANGKRYPFNLDLGNVRPGPGNHPIHGFLTNATEWRFVNAQADETGARVTSRLEFYRRPEWMAQWPFAHTIEMTYRLTDGTLEVITKITNLSTAPMPVAIGFHPYFQVNDAPRDEWTFAIAARTNWILAPDKIPTGETRPIEQFLPKPQGGPLKGLNLDDVFSDLIRDSSGKATMWVQGKSERVEVSLGPNYKSVVVWSPGSSANFICFEPMAGITDALNLAAKGKYNELQSIPPDQTWQESFWVKPVGF